MELPAIVCLRSVYNEKYLRFRAEGVQSRGLLQFSGEHLLDPLVQFEVVQSEAGGGLVHLKSRYSNRFLSRWSPNHHWITASAYAPEEDQSKWNCTLFQTIIVDDEGDTKTIRLVHVQLGHYVSLWRVDAPFDDCLYAGSSDPDQDSCDVFAVVDWELRLPHYVAFKGENGQYLGAKTSEDGLPGLQFSYDNPRDPEVIQEIFSTPDGVIYIRSEYYDKFWRLGDDNWIVVDGDDPRETEDVNAMFRAYKLDVDHIDLLNLGTTLFCKRFTVGDEMESFLSAAAESPDEFSRLQVIHLD